MGGILGGGSKPKEVKPPPVLDPPPVPVESTEAEDFAAKDIQKRGGFARSAFITGNLAPTSKGKKTTLG